MAVKPLTKAQKTVLASFARVVVAAEVSANIKGLEGFKKQFLKDDPEAAQAERAFQKAVMEERSNLLRGMKEDGA
ncbi:hypothetical protein SAMN03080615_00872 [Amphritea atlantica]|uniref:Uncharacterized protein n=1 Tax=Amphritea atlantica TaxID=355243 RepID=A0A1H9EFC8_9GAMM|nr:hypothetical protein [Amphritea atlantica]SEQ24430.1 hypothetical protein SAMN03080615_00872 [Amphritea atlantica]